MRVGTGPQSAVYFLHGDHLGSVSMTTNASGEIESQARFTPFGEELTWAGSGEAVTDFGFTGQRNERGFGLMDYNARFYSSSLGRFISPDSIIPGAGNPMAWDRYAYALGNPILYNDPSGHCPICVGVAAFVGFVGAVVGSQLGQAHAYGLLPDYRGIRTAERIVTQGNSITIQGAQTSVNVDATAVAAGIAVQSEWYIPGADSRNGYTTANGSGIGYAQVADWQMNTPILDENEDYTGGYGLEGVDQTTDEGAVMAMATRIGLVLEVLEANCTSCTAKDKLIASALAQNGSGFNANSMFDAIRNGAVNWDKVFDNYDNPSAFSAQIRQNMTGLQFDTELMLLLYLNDLRELHNRGWELPWGLTEYDLDEIQETYVPSNAE